MRGLIQTQVVDQKRTTGTGKDMLFPYFLRKFHSVNPFKAGLGIFETNVRIQ